MKNIFMGMLVATVLTGFVASNATAGPIPIPKKVEAKAGTFKLTEATITYSAEELKPLATMLSKNLRMVFDIKIPAKSKVKKGNKIVLAADKSYAAEKYTMVVSKDTIKLTGANYKGVSMAIASLIQSIKLVEKELAVPCMKMEDYPDSEYRGLLVDVARHWHSIDTLKKIVVMCQLYKINYIQLHLNDDQSCPLPSKAFPKMASKPAVVDNGFREIGSYKVKDLKELVAFADRRGVTLVPELDCPGHTGAMRKNMPELFGPSNLGIVDIADPKVYEAFETLVKEVCEIFKSSPYFHIGADECNLGPISGKEKTKAYVKKLGLDNTHDLYYHFITKMDQYVKDNGKKTLMWESFSGDGSRKVKIPKDIIVMAWETMYQMPQSLIDNGYTIINASWKPMYLVPGIRWEQDHIFDWNIYRWENHWQVTASYCPFEITPTNKVIGGQMCSWEQAEWMELPGLRVRVPVACERFWNIRPICTYEEFHKDWLHSDKILNLLMTPLWVKADGLIAPGDIGVINNRANWFDKELTIKMMPSMQGTEVRYTTDGSVPTVDSTRYTEPFTIKETANLKAKVFTRNGIQAGQMYWVRYQLKPLKVKVEGLLPGIHHPEKSKDREWFDEEITFTVDSALPGTIKYKTGRDFQKYTKPVSVKKSCTFEAMLFDSNNKPVGEVYRHRVKKAPYRKSLTTGKPITASTNIGRARGPENIVDGVAINDHYWDSSSNDGPQWAKVDLGKVEKISKVEVCCYTDGSRYYQYYVEVSKDGKKWTKVVDRSKNKEVSTSNGIADTFDPIEARYVRLTMLKNSSNPGLHVTDLRVW